MTQKTKHTPTPWKCGKTPFEVINRCHGEYVDFNITRDNVITAYCYDEANAAHIVKCVNMHDELVEVLSGLMKVYNEPDMEICCNGYHCGCQGASVRQQAEHYARETLKKAGAL